MRLSFVAPLCSVVCFLSAGVAPVLADDHVVREHVRSYFGRVAPTLTSEVWISDDKVCYRFGDRSTTLLRFDQGKQYVLNHRDQRYLEEPLEAKDDETGSEEKAPERMNEAGFHYQPDYDWTVERTDQVQEVNGTSCRLYIFEGEADYAEERRECCYARQSTIDIDRYYKLFIEQIGSDEALEILALQPELRSSLVMEEKRWREPAIAPMITWKIKLVKLESAAPPAGIYELPEGYQKVMSREELYAR